MKLIAKMIDERRKKGIVTVETFEFDVPFVGVIHYDVYENPSFSYRRCITKDEYGKFESTENLRDIFIDSIIYEIKMHMLLKGMNPSDYWEV